ncbi:hypothetical protein [Vibrio parahaemolyticus]|uniref:hypothetical protein n=1 Tax=Vibrio parahaemolyticus TaxID=670 RepID=UPI00226B0672|nr:hypothetical protein [Vibrio parahaemolyticus]MCX8914832.1 hypothetical protein [Vibrio parahaemolyticus]
MAKKFFIATCEKKVSKHPVKDGKVFTVPVSADTQVDARESAKAEIMQLDATSFEGTDSAYDDWFKRPALEKITEEEFNAAVLELQAAVPTSDELTEEGELQQNLPGTPYPVLSQDGFFDTKDPKVEESSYIYSSETDNMQAAKVFVLRVGCNQYAYGFRYKFGGFDKHERMNLDRIEEKRDDAVDQAIGRLESFLDYQDEFGTEEQKPFISALMNHDFYRAFLEPSELFIEAVSKHPDIQNALGQYGDFYEVVEGHFADIWPLDKSPEQAIEHVNSMVTIGVLYDLEAFTESLKPYLPAVLTEKTKESMKHIEDVIDKPAANDSTVEPKCWKAALPVTDKLHVVIAIRDCGDEGWQSASEGNLKSERAFGDANDFSGEFAATRKEAIKMAGQAITDALYRYDSSLSLAKAFMKSPYIQDFEENCIEITVGDDVEQSEGSPIEAAIRERLARRPVANTTEAEVALALDSIMPHVTDQTNIEALVEAIGGVEKCGILFSEDDAAHLVTGCTVATNSQPKEPTHNLNNEHECFIAEILSRIGDEGSSCLTSEQYDEAGEKLATVIDELTNWYDGEREHDGKYPVFDKVKTLSNISDADFDDESEVAKVFLNIRSLRALFRENIELIENSKPTSDQTDETQKPEVEYPALLQAITERLENESHAVTPERAYTQLLNIINETTDIDGLAEYIKQLKNPVIIWHSTESVNLVMKFTNQPSSNGNNEPTSGNNEPKEPQNLPVQAKNKPKVTSNGQKVTSKDPLPQSANDELIADSDSNINGTGVPQNIVKQEPANDSEIEFDDQTKYNRSIWDKVCTTQRRFTKPVEYGERKYTAVDIDHQIEQATNMWGCYGEDWGLTEIHETERGCLISAKTTFFYPSPNTGKRVEFPLHNSIPFKRVYSSKNGPYESYDDDYFKKLESNFLSRAFAKLGWNADVRQGKFEDEHYMFVGSLQDQAQLKLEQMERENEAFDNAMVKVQTAIDKFKQARNLAEMKRFKEQAQTHLSAVPETNDDLKRKKKEAEERLNKRFNEAHQEFVDELASQKGESNG